MVPPAAWLTASSSCRPTSPAFNDFVDLVVSELQRGGLYRKDYSGPILRDHLGSASAVAHDREPAV
jgi:hypothetical protein